MDMIGHDRPGEQFVMRIVELQHRLFGDQRDPPVPQMAPSNALVQVRLELGPLFPGIFDCQQMLPFTASRFGHGIPQTKGDELNQTWIVAVWQIAALVPAQETQGFLLCRERAEAPVLFRHQLPQILLFRARCHIFRAQSSSSARSRSLLPSRRAGALRSYPSNCRST